MHNTLHVVVEQVYNYCTAKWHSILVDTGKVLCQLDCKTSRSRANSVENDCK